MSNELNSQDLINKQILQLHKLVDLLIKEKEVLQQHNPEKLTALTNEKNILLIAIKELDDGIGRNTQFAQDKVAGILENELIKVKELLEECKKQNSINGLIIQQSQLAVGRMKTSLLESHNKSAMTYNEKGKKSAGLSSLNLKA